MVAFVCKGESHSQNEITKPFHHHLRLLAPASCFHGSRDAWATAAVLGPGGCLGFLYKNKTQPKTRPLPDQRRAAGTGAQQTECVPGGGWGATERPLPHAPQAAGLPLLMPSSQKTGEVGGPIFTCSVGAMHHRVVTRPEQYWPDASSALCSCPGRGSSFPSRHLSGSPAAGTTGQHRLCSGWQSPPWAGGSH